MIIYRSFFKSFIGHGMYLRRHHYARINARSWFLGILNIPLFLYPPVLWLCVYARLEFNRSNFYKWSNFRIDFIHSTSKAEQIVTITSQSTGEILLKVYYLMGGLTTSWYSKYIKCFLCFIHPGMDFNFQKHDRGRIQYLGQPYDLGNIIKWDRLTLIWY
jgi:hypothetical protein